jgi:drug/metabolite transporter (DMT)-like permease
MQALAVTLIFLGNLTIGGFRGFEYSQGELFVLAATILWAFENILAKKILPSVDPDVVTAFRMGIGSVILLTASEITQPGSLKSVFNLSATQAFLMIATIVALSGYITTWYRALKFAPAIAVSTILTSATLVTNILSAIFITHSLNSGLVVQSALILIGVAIFIRSYKNLPTTKPKVAYKEV